MVANYFRNSQVIWKSLNRRRVILNNVATLSFYFPKLSGWLEKHSNNTNTFLWEFNVLLDRVMVLNLVYMSISSLNSGFSIADFLCRGAMQSKLEQPCHLPWHGFKQNVLGWHPSVHSSTWLYDRSSVQPSNSRPRIPKEEVDLFWKMSFHVRSDRFYRHSAEVCLQCHMQWLRRPLQGGLIHREASSQEMRWLLAMGGARHSSCIYFGNLKWTEQQ